MRTIFWKIFAIIWLSSVVIALGSWFMLFQDTLRKAQEVEWQESFQEQLAGLTSQYERWGELLSDQTMPIYLYGVNFVVLEELTGDLVHGNPAQLDLDNSRDISYTSEAGKKYLVYIPKPDYSFLVSVVSAATEYRLWLALLVSSLFSLLLSMVIVRPIKRLQKHIDIMGDGELDTRLDRKLTKRRDEFGNLARSFNDMVDRIQSLVGSKQQLLHDVSHELRAPLARLQVAGELARGEAENAGIDGAMYDRLDRECQSLNTLIDEVLTLSRAEASNGDEKPQPCDLTAALQQMIADARFLNGEREIGFQVTGAERSVPLVLPLLERAVKNILENALKYSPAEQPVSVSLAFESDQVVIDITDRGPGLPEEELARIFTPFYRAKAYDSKEGYGLGMSIAQKAIAQLGGEIRATNCADGGLLVAIVLPNH